MRIKRTCSMKASDTYHNIELGYMKIATKTITGDNQMTWIEFMKYQQSWTDEQWSEYQEKG